MAAVELRELTKVYADGFRAVDRVSLKIADGELVVLVGPSGCGKSTTLRMIAGLEEITSGELLIGGRRMNDVHPRDRDIAMVFQNYALYPHMSARRNMRFGLEKRRRWGSRLRRWLSPAYRAAARAEDRALDRRVEEVARTLGITELLDKKPGALSGGQRQRVAVGRAMVREPVAFLFDEPLSNLDARLRVEMRSELRALHRRLEATMVYVTHDQEEAMTLGDRLVVMEGGVVQQCASPAEIYARPANRFVAGFVGTPSMNFIEGELVGAGQGVRFEAPGLSLALPRAPRPEGSSRPVVLGVRPDRLVPGEHRPGATLRAEVRQVEPLGDRVDVRLVAAGGPELVARVPPREELVEGATLEVGIDIAAAHLFEPGPRGARLA